MLLVYAFSAEESDVSAFQVDGASTPVASTATGSGRDTRGAKLVCEQRLSRWHTSTSAMSFHQGTSNVSAVAPCRRFSVSEIKNAIVVKMSAEVGPVL